MGHLSRNTPRVLFRKEVYAGNKGLRVVILEIIGKLYEHEKKRVTGSPGGHDHLRR